MGTHLWVVNGPILVGMDVIQISCCSTQLKEMEKEKQIPSNKN